MNESKPKSVRTVGIILIVLSIMLIFSNAMGAMMYFFVMKDGFALKAGQTPTLLNYYLEMCLTLITTGIFFLIGGIFIIKYKKWANRFTTIVVSILILWIWICMIVLMIPINFNQNNAIILVVVNLFIGLIASIPLLLLIRFLNRKQIKKAFS